MPGAPAESAPQDGPLTQGRSMFEMSAEVRPSVAKLVGSPLVQDHLIMRSYMDDKGHMYVELESLNNPQFWARGRLPPIYQGAPSEL